MTNTTTGKKRGPDILSHEALDWSLTHVRKFGDTDIFPVPFEYEAIAHDWNSIKPHLLTLDFGEYKVGTDRRLFIPKPGGGFRAAMELDPLDHLVYTAVIFEAADLIEKARIPKEKKIACSYRVELSSDGNFFESPEIGWANFHDHSKSLAYSGNFSHILLADVSDFYNQLGHHRIQNALESAAVDADRSRNLETFLGRFTAKQSQGLPVGPTASILLAEACLIDVDNFLLRQGVPHVRYVDDFRIFCENRKEATDIRHGLTDYLFSVHRLSLEGSKSYISFVDRFIRDELTDPEEQEQQAKIDKFKELFNERFESDGYWGIETSGDTDDEDQLLSQAEEESFIELFESVARPTVQLGLARHLLRKALRGRTVILNNLVFDRFESLIPVIRDVVRYLAVTIPKKNAQKRGEELLKFVYESDVGNLPSVVTWVLELILKRPDLCDAPEALKFANHAAKSMGSRALALTAKVYNQIDWVRSRKETWRNFESWDRRAVIWSTSILPSGERRPFLDMVVEQGDVLDASIAKYLLSK